MLKKLSWLVAAFGLGMLLAPKSGKDTRKDLSRKVEEVKSKMGKEK
jgi:gas vesicle protein